MKAALTWPVLCELKEELLVVNSHVLNDTRALVPFVELLDERLVIVLDLVASQHLERHLTSMTSNQTYQDLLIVILVEDIGHQVAEGTQTGLRLLQQIGLLMEYVLVAFEYHLLVHHVLALHAFVYQPEICLFAQACLAIVEDLKGLDGHEVRCDVDEEWT